MWQPVCVGFEGYIAPQAEFCSKEGKDCSVNMNHLSGSHTFNCTHIMTSPRADRNYPGSAPWLVWSINLIMAITAPREEAVQ